MREMEHVVGQLVTGLWVEEDGEHEIRIACASGVLRMPVWGDCCSESWWADAFGVRQLVGATITGIEETDIPHCLIDGRCRQDRDLIYGVRITTDRGACDLVFRNSSNGYYGGECRYVWEDGELDGAGYREITGDWSA